MPQCEWNEADRRNAAGYIAGLVDGYGGPTVWQALSRDAKGHLTSAKFGNGTNPVWSFDPNTGRETGYAAHPSVGSNAAFQWGILTWDQLGNLTQRQDVYDNITEKYQCGELNRLTGITLPNNGNATENSFSYDVPGRMLTKGDVGTTTYPPAGQKQPHGVSSISGSSGTTSVTYDADGNVTAESGATTRGLTWTPYNMPSTITMPASRSGSNTTPTTTAPCRRPPRAPPPTCPMASSCRATSGTPISRSMASACWRTGYRR